MARPIRYCTVDGCSTRRFANGLCLKHYKRLSRHGDVSYERTTRLCSVPDCGRKHFGHGLCRVHYFRQRNHGTLEEATVTTADRFWAKVDKNGPIPDQRPDLGPCWLWTGGIAANGYAKFRAEGRSVSGHRYSVTLHRGPIPEGLTVDHLCFVRACVNPRHLDVVPAEVNIRRAADLVTHCPQGHPYDEANTYVNKHGHRLCRACSGVAKKPSHRQSNPVVRSIAR